MLSQGERVSTDPVLLIRLVLTGLPSTDAETRRFETATQGNKTKQCSIMLQKYYAKHSKGLQNVY